MNIDLLLYQRIVDGDEKALDELINKYRSSLTLFINGFVKDIDAAESLMIDVFVELVCSKSKFRGESSLKTYLFAIGRIKALHYLKKRKNYDFIPLEDAEYCLPAEQTLEDEIFEQLRRETVRKAVGQLNPSYREIIYLLYFEEMSYDEAARVLHKSKKQVFNLAFRAKQSLKKTITEWECLD